MQKRVYKGLEGVLLPVATDVPMVVLYLEQVWALYYDDGHAVTSAFVGMLPCQHSESQFLERQLQDS